VSRTPARQVYWQATEGQRLSPPSVAAGRVSPVNDEDLDRQFVELCEEMIEAWCHAPVPERLKVAQISRANLSDVGAITVVWGWTARVARTAEATLSLHREGFDVEAAPLVRSMLEHAIAIFWLVDKRGPAYQALARARALSWQKFKQAQATGRKLDVEKAELLERAVTVETDDDTLSKDYLLSTAHRAVAYNLGLFYQAWLIETWGTHATMLSAEPYFTFSDSLEEGTATVTRLHHVPRNTERETAAATVTALHAALTGYEQAVPDAFSGRLT
jgi:hypothetical protein